MIGAVDWGAHPGELLEEIMAVLVAQDHPDVVRRTPASGDGGIDLMVPVEGGWEVHQVKRFAHRIKTDEKRQIRDSWSNLRDDPRLDGPIVAYKLVVPTDPTPDEQRWFEELVGDAPFPTAWRGRVHWNSLAAQHPHVIDYYLGGGRERVIERAMALQSATAHAGQVLVPTEVATRVGGLVGVLNQDDPHYRYDIQTSRQPPAVTTLPECVMAATLPLDNGDFVTVIVNAKHSYAIEDEPIFGTLQIQADDPELAEALRDFEVFGTSLSIPEGALSGTINAPGGLGGEFEGGAAWIGPAEVIENPDPFRLVVVDSAGNVRAELLVEVSRVTAGPLGGQEITFADPSSTIDGRLRIHPVGDDGMVRAELQLGFAAPAGKRLRDVMPAIRLLAAADDDSRLQIRLQYGDAAPLEVGAVPDDLQLSTPVVRHFEDLDVLQDFAAGPITAPEQIDVELANALRPLVQMLQGEELTDTWTECRLRSEDGGRRARVIASMSEGAALALTDTMRVTVEGQDIELGPFATFFATAVPSPEQPEDETILVVVPGEDDTRTRRAGGLSEHITVREGDSDISDH